MIKQNETNVWQVYFVRCRNNALYCGITNNITRRFAQHQAGTGAKYLKGKGPLRLVWSYPVADKSTALKLEYKIKQLPKTKKEAICKGDKVFLETLIASQGLK